jgi:hypothetical protein
MYDAIYNIIINLREEFERIPAGLHRCSDYAFANSPLQTVTNIFLCYWSSVLDPSQVLKLYVQKIEGGEEMLDVEHFSSRQASCAPQLL